MTNQQPISATDRPKRCGDNRTRLVAAGYRVLAEQGYEATTVKEIARVAGVSPGLFHYYFASKDELLLAVLREAADRYTALMARLRATVPAERLASAALQRRRERAEQEPEWFRLRYELFALGLRKPAFLPAVAELLAAGRRGIAQTISTMSAAGDHASDRPDALAAVALACVDGLALQQIAQPDLDLTASYDLLLRLIEVARQTPP